jgi:hypothetical protein
MIEYLPLVLTGIGIIVSILYYASILRNANKTRQSQLFMQIHSNWYDPDFWRRWREVTSVQWKDFEEYDEKYGFYNNPDFGDKCLAVTSFFAGIGVLVHRKMIDPYLVDDLIAGMIIAFWEKYREVFKEIRVRRKWPSYGEWVEYLYNVIKPIAEKQHPETKGTDRIPYQIKG